MALSNELVSQFAKIAKDDTKTKTESTVYGTTVEYNGSVYVKLDGSDLLTPISTTTDMKPGERVTVMIKNHTATVTGNMSSPSARTDDVKEIGSKISEFEIVMAYKVTTEDLEATNAIIESLKAKVAKFSDMEAINADIEKLQAKYANLEYVSATDVEALNADIENLKAKFGEFTDISTDDLEAINADIENLKAYNADFTYVSADVLVAYKADIKKLEAEKLSAKDADIKYANIDFSNIGKAAMEYLYANSGLIKDVVIDNGTITGNLVGVTISGDLIEGNTVVAEKLVIKGEDGLYYKLNTDGVGIEAEQTDYNSLNGSVIKARSITATKIAVEDLVAFDATIGGFNITEKSIYSGVKESVDNTTRGIYLDRDGQIAFGDSTDFIKYYKDSDGNYRLAISARSIIMSSSNKNIGDAVDEAQKAADAAIISSVEQFYQSDSPTSLSGGEWSIIEPVWIDGKYLWRRNKVTHGDGSIDYTPSENGVCITGNTGATGEKGEDSTLLRIESSRGTVFKNDNISTVLSVVIYHGSQRITDSETMKSVFGNTAYLQWKWQRVDEDSFGIISSSDSRFGNDGFTFTLSPDDVDTKITFMCDLII